MRAKMIKWLLAGACALMAACAIITVNVYFPEEGAKEAYKSLDGMLLKSSEEKAPAGEKTPLREQSAPEAGPRSRLIDAIPSLSLCSPAYAADNLADDLAVELAGMPEVMKAYDEMSRRLPRINALFSSGVIGLTSQGLVSVRDKTKITAQDEALVQAENQNRKTVVTSMAKAIVKLTKQPETKAVMEQMLGKAAATFAETKRESAKPGWWIQLPNGRWVQK
ncbi:MAG: DUF1318 domain-containing protein [Deltaproteobacteria bacterium]|nr:DUF1318 domain-containing protein [Deltaproteobacteria bacterium]